jgi:hypothetical protein
MQSAQPFSHAAEMAPSTAATRKANPFTAVRLNILGTIFLQRLGMNLPIGGQLFPFPASMAITPAVVGWNFATGAAPVAIPRLILYAVFVAMMAISALLNAGGLSTMSMFLVAGIYAMFLFPMQLDEPAYKRFFRMIADVASVICLLGVAQYVIQFVWQPDWLFSWRKIVPSQFLIEYNTLNVTRYGSGIYKANGFFLMEASFQSQLAARALLISIFVLRDYRYIVPLGLGLLTAYSGTGLVLFGIFGLIPLLALAMRDRRVASFVPIALLMLPLVLLLLWTKLDMGLFLERMNEFSNPRSSGYARFVTSQLMFRLFSNADLLQLLFGAGPGSTDYYMGAVQSAGESFASTWIKLLLDYGVLGFAAFITFFYTCIRHTLRSHWLATAFTFHFFFLDGGFAAPQQAFMTLLLGAFVCLKAPAKKEGAPVMSAPSPNLARHPLGR